MARRYVLRSVKLVTVVVLLALIGGCGFLARTWRLTEQPQGPCLGDNPAFEDRPGRHDAVRSQEWTGDWSWEHLGWECVRTWFPSGKTETVYVR